MIMEGESPLEMCLFLRCQEKNEFNLDNFIVPYKMILMTPYVLTSEVQHPRLRFERLQMLHFANFSNCKDPFYAFNNAISKRFWQESAGRLAGTILEPNTAAYCDSHTRIETAEIFVNRYYKEYRAEEILGDKYIFVHSAVGGNLDISPLVLKNGKAFFYASQIYFVSGIIIDFAKNLGNDEIKKRVEFYRQISLDSNMKYLNGT